MKATVIALLAVLVSAPAFADHIGIYADIHGGECISGPLKVPPAFNTAYVVHIYNIGATGSQFKINDTSGLFLASSAVTPPFLMIGNLYTGASIAYTSCIFGYVTVATLNYFWFGAPNNCGGLQIVPDPSNPSGTIAVADCTFAIEVATGGSFIFGDNTCQTPCSTNATQSSTWGGVKALYR